MNLKQFNICMVNNIAVICETRGVDPQTDLKYFTIDPAVQLRNPPCGRVLAAVSYNTVQGKLAIEAKDTATYELVKLRDLKPIELVSTRKSVYVALTNKAHFKNKLGVIHI